MPPVQLFFLVSSLAIFAIAWLKGGHAERVGVTWLILAYLASVLLQDFDVGRFRPAEALVDLALTIAFFRLALTSSRWWPLLVCGLMVLTLVAHGVALMEPGLNLRSSVATRWVLGILAVY